MRLAKLTKNVRAAVLVFTPGGRIPKGVDLDKILDGRRYVHINTNLMPGPIEVDGDIHYPKKKPHTTVCGDLPEWYAGSEIDRAHEAVCKAFNIKTLDETPSEPEKTLQEPSQDDLDDESAPVGALTSGPDDEEPEDDDEETIEDELTAEDVKLMDKEALNELCKENGISIDPKDKKSVGKYRSAVVKALEL